MACSRKHENLPEAFNFCPYCGEKIPRVKDDEFINGALLQRAKSWPTDKKQLLFFQNVLNLPNRIANAFYRARVTPEEIVTMTRKELRAIHGIGRDYANTVITNRNAYQK